MFGHNCRDYSVTLITRLDPENADEARGYLRRLLRNQRTKEIVVESVQGMADDVSEKVKEGVRARMTEEEYADASNNISIAFNSSTKAVGMSSESMSASKSAWNLQSKNQF